ncbi:MAG: hypothetical protein WDN72_06000 [Alphaproteobacteria bacterium]
MLLGTHSEQAVLDEIALREPRSIHLGGKTSIAQIAELARGGPLRGGQRHRPDACHRRHRLPFDRDLLARFPPRALGTGRQRAYPAQGAAAGAQRR